MHPHDSSARLPPTHGVYVPIQRVAVDREPNPDAALISAAEAAVTAARAGVLGAGEGNFRDSSQDGWGVFYLWRKTGVGGGGRNQAMAVGVVARFYRR
jgi:hypothetical protein